MTKTNNKAAVAGLLKKRMAEIYRRGNEIPPLELGTIDGGMNLLVDGIASPIPDYMVCRSLTLGAKDGVLTKTKKDGAHSHPSVSSSGAEHEHNVLIPEKMRKLQPGDRVLVAWASGTPVVIDIVQDKG
jgi:hypothetical protein